MLGGDFVSGLEESIRESTKNRSRMSGARNSSPSFVAESCVNHALGASGHQAKFSDLKPHVSADRVKSSTVPGGGRSNLEDLFQLVYTPPRPIVAILTPQSVKIYKRIFHFICPLRFLFSNVNEVGRRLLRATHDEMKAHPIYIRFLNIALCAVRQFISGLVRYIFDEVLPLESAKLLCNMRKELNLHSLSVCHSDHVNCVGVALFLHKTAKPVLDAIDCCLHSGRKILAEVERVCARFEEAAADQMQRKQSIKSMQAQKKENIDIALLARMESELASSNSLTSKALNASQGVLVDLVNVFKGEYERLRTEFRNLDDASVKQSGSWKKFECALLGEG